MAWSLEQLGLLATDRDDPAAATLLRQSLEVHRELRDRWRTASVLEDLAALALALGGAVPAARLLAAAESIREAIGTVVPPCESAQHAETLTSARAALGDDGFEAAWRQGLMASLDELQAELPQAGQATTAGPVADQAAAGTGAAEAGAAEAGAGPAGAADPAQRRRPGRATPHRPSPLPDGEADAAAAAGGSLRIRALGAATVHRG